MSRRPPMFAWLISVLLVLGLAVLAGCGGSGGNAGPSTATSPGEESESALSATPLPKADQPPGTVVHVGIHNGEVSSDQDRVELDRGAPVSLVISADKPGELHVHSTPEQHVEFSAGRSSATLTFDQPGVIDVEDHALDKLILQLEIR